MAKKFYYFDLNGLGEGLRYMLHYGQVEFEDIRYDREKWLKGEVDKSIAPFGQLPVYEEENKGSINQSVAIYRYVGQSLNLGLGDPFKDAQLDALALTILDLMPKFIIVFASSDPKAREAATKTFLSESVSFFFSRFDKQIKENNGFLFGKLTWVDFFLVGLTECFDLLLETKVESNYPSIQALMRKIHSYPGVKKYFEAKKPYHKYI